MTQLMSLLFIRDDAALCEPKRWLMTTTRNEPASRRIEAADTNSNSILAAE